MESFRAGKLMRIFVDENDRSGMQPMYTAVVETLRKAGISGATVLRGVEGFGSRQAVHVAKVFSWSPNLPIVIEVVEDEASIERVVPALQAMIGEGLITIEATTYLRIG